MDSLGSGYRAAVIGATGGIGSAFVAALAADPNCAAVTRLARSSEPPLDLEDEASIRAAAEHLATAAGTLELVIDATGALTIDGRGPEKSLRQIDPAVMQRAFAINATGPALLFKHFAPLLPRRRRALFATLSARVGSITDNRRGGWISYRASKAALNQIVQTAAIEIAFRHPEAVCVGLQPGTVRTRLSEPFARGTGILEPADAVARLLRVLDRLQPGDSGGLFDHAGERIPA